MDALEAIYTRRSIRKYTDLPLSAGQLNTLLEAGMNAPSALDEQPWQFIVITDPKKLQAIPKHHSHSDLVANAPAAILVCADMSCEKLPGFWVQDCSACTQNILLAAHAEGLGAVWIGVYPTEANVVGLKKLFELPEQIIPFALVAVGHADEPYLQKENFQKDRIHTDSW